MSEIVRMGLKISGEVQGVGFRWFAQQTACAFALTGFVENLEDKTVWVEVQGEASLVEEYCRQLRKGRGFIEVAEIKKKKLELADDYSFTIR